MKKILYFLMILLLGLIQPSFAKETTQGLSLDAFKRLPILEQGRIKPLETYAQNVLLRFSGRRSFDRKPAITWLSKHVFRPETTADDKVFLINHPDIPAALDISKEKRRRYSFAQLEPNLKKIFELSEAALKIEEKERTLVENEIIRVSRNVELYIALGHSFQFAYPSESFRLVNDASFEAFKLSKENNPFSFLDFALITGRMEPFVKAHGVKQAEAWSVVEREALKIVTNLYQWSLFYRQLPFAILPSVDSEEETWLSPWDAISEQFPSVIIREEIQQLRHMALAYRDGKQLEFDTAIRQFRSSIQNRGGKTFERAAKYLDLEVFYNERKLFFWAKLFYGFAFFLFIVFLLSSKKIFYGSAYGLTVVGFLMHVVGLTIRIILLARPPVTTLYETFVFVAIMSVFLGLLIEVFNRKGLGILTASVSGFLFLIIAGKYSAEGDTLKMLVAVLNSNFWLSVHVPTITMGYAATCVAGVLGHIYILQAFFKPKDQASLQATYRNMMGILGLSLILTFFGTCLGGIWADQSWGRFWGWDPKENGALMIVLWTAMIFHARMAGLVKAIGVSVLTILGIIVVAWAWFGVNLLSIGLHSYGFTSGVAKGLAFYVLAEILFLGIFTPLADRKQKIA